jgi:D-glycero-alpha-D-manno-heptose-7-phosphate kinase
VTIARNLYDSLKTFTVETTAPCRIDMGGTLDLAIFYNPLRHLLPCTFNIAVDLRTTVKLLPYSAGRIKVSSRGFKSAEFPADRAPFDHPLGLMFATAAYFQADGLHVIIESGSPPRSALGGSSAASVALIAAFMIASQNLALTPKVRRQIALLAHRIEESVAGVPCGRQDHLAAAFGGVNAWYWQPEQAGFDYKKIALINKRGVGQLRRRILLAYCGVPHASKDVNGRWVHQFLAGEHRAHWHEIVELTKKFIDALAGCNYKEAAEAMNRETALRREMTPDVLDEIGVKLVDAARSTACGSRFTGAGGGGCLWALGDIEKIDRLRPVWKEILSERPEACLLEWGIDTEGLAGAIFKQERRGAGRPMSKGIK